MRKHNARHLLATLAALAIAPSVQSNVMTLHTAPGASINAAHAAIAAPSRVRRQSPLLLRGNLYRSAGLFKHCDMNQRQRRKFNRQRNAAGIKKAFA